MPPITCPMVKIKQSLIDLNSTIVFGKISRKTFIVVIFLFLGAKVRKKIELTK